MIAGLPPDAAVKRNRESWTFDQHLQVQLVETVHTLLRLTHASLSRRKGSRFTPIPPLHIPRPGEVVKSKAIKPAAFFRMMIGGD